jgi:dTDP-4-amino-4,6-dideoxygalactose transaminase
MTAIMEVAGRHGLWVVEDNAQSQGATWQGQPTGSFGALTAPASIRARTWARWATQEPSRPTTPAWPQKVQTLRNYGSQKKYYNEVIGINSRLDELQAAVLRVKLRQLPAWTMQRQHVADLYRQQLAGLPDLQLPKVAAGATHVYHLYVVRTSRREALQQHLTQQGVGTLIHYPVPPHLQQAYAHLNVAAGTFPIAEELANTCLSLPCGPA